MGAKKIPMRMCIGCREMKPKKELVRIVKTPEGEIKTDLTGKLNGRGAYICRDTECLAKVKKIDGLSHTFETKVPVNVYEKLEKELESDE